MKTSKLEQSLSDALAMYAHDLPPPVREYAFVPGRRFRADFAWPDARVMVECQGGTFLPKSRHNSGAGLAQSFEKLNLAATLGWRVLQFGAPDLRGRALTTTVDTIRRAIRAKEAA